MNVRAYVLEATAIRRFPLPASPVHRLIIAFRTQSKYFPLTSEKVLSVGTELPPDLKLFRTQGKGSGSHQELNIQQLDCG